MTAPATCFPWAIARLPGWSGLPLILLTIWGASVWGASATAQTVDIPVPPPSLDRLDIKKDPPPPNSPPPAARTRPPARPTPLADFNRYRLGPGDSIFVNVLRFPDLSFQGTLDLEGNLLVPLVGSLRLDGQTLNSARLQIQQELNRFVVNPQVDVILVAQRPVRVTVLGEVFRPGYYPMESPQLSTALLASGGTTRQADLRRVTIRRTAPTGAALERTFDLYTPLRDSTALPAVRLSDGDTVIVPALTAANRDGYDPDLTARSTLAQPQINIRVLNYSNSLGGRGGGRAIANITLPNGSDFLDAIAAIGPNPDTADLRDIALIRYDPDQGRAIRLDFNARRALRGDPEENPRLQHNDVIIIGRNLISRVTYALNVFTQPFRDVLGFLLFFDRLTEASESLFEP
ncbi:polysaccharide export protein [Thermoleptolyngbya sichuanensis A183]|uniref:Polysaccharide export protein n=1 Tax=Thermoleptolyngbya sichuanensis A183 TaxID=2737172 RepID=A0A6M8B931_9CYAN|nr:MULTISPECIES: polysaccharide biosynthesis/export family protein [Thermoleptolyngbya]QKD82988.1 polysaccharide export protein [Thermoleptolyngbya sichuanensis A183]